jgi:hypothetical protein
MLALHTLAIPTFVTSLQALDAILEKAEAFCATKKIDPAVMAATRLIPDMLPLTRQVLIACDFAKNGSARLAGVEPPVFEDTETTLAQLRERIARTIAYVQSVDPALIDAAPGRIVEMKTRTNRLRQEASLHLVHFILPNFYFHVTTAYAILRSSGLEIGKLDFMGAVPGLERLPLE